MRVILLLSLLVFAVNAIAAMPTNDGAYGANSSLPTWKPFFLSWDNAKAFGSNVAGDYENFYSGQSLLKFAAGLAVGAALANTSADQDVANWYQGQVRDQDTNNFQTIFKPFGTPKYMLYGYAGVLGVSLLTKNTEFGNTLGLFSQKYLESLLVGLPVLWFGQRVLGGDRPSDPNGSSHWHPFHNSHGFSGHAFDGAVPFLVAAHMTSQPALKAAFYGLSTFTGIARINQNSHYLSQVMLGWWLAYLSVDSVFNPNHHNYQITPIAYRDGGGVEISTTF